MAEKKVEKKESRKLPIVKINCDFTPKHALGAEGPLAKSVADYQVRESQISLAEQLQIAFDEGRHLIAEAATGIGKSYACLLAAFRTSAETRSPVVISTHTIALQEQLVDKDVPFLLGKLGLNLNVVLAKGRGNYVSIRRAKIAIKERQKGYLKLGKWLQSTKDGTKSSLPNLDHSTWARARSDTDQCMGETCPTFKECFYQKSRRQLNDAHVIITNHNLVLLDLKMKSTGMKGVLPDYSYLIFDEGHEVEHVARQVFTFELRQRDLSNIFQEIWNDTRSNGFLNKMDEAATKILFETKAASSNEATEHKAKAVTIKDTIKSIKELIQENDKFFKKVAAFTGSTALQRIVKKNSFKTDLYPKLSTILGNLKSLNANLIDKDQKTAVDYAAKRCTEIALGVDQILNLPNVPGKDYPEIVAWASARFTSHKTRAYSVVVAPIFLKPTMRKMVFNKIKSVVLTSATLATGGKNPFRMIESTLGIDNPMRLRLPSSFNYQEQACAIVIEDMPEQKDSKYITELSKQIKKYGKSIPGGAFILFTSFQVMNKVYDECKVNLEMAGYKLFCQGKGLTRKQMIFEFKKSNRGILFGVSSFWTGIDIPGKSLCKLIITKLPFPSPADPLMQAQEEIYKKFGRDFFMERSIPMTSIMLKQGFGRLIRKDTDKGIVVILDSRVVKKKYGPMLLQSALPKTCPVIYARRDASLT